MSNTEHHLKDKFALYFLFPFLLAIILSLAINLLYILNYINRLPYDNDIIKMVKIRDEETTVPIITKAKSLYQDIVCNYYDSNFTEFVSSLNMYTPFDARVYTYINEYCVGAYA